MASAVLNNILDNFSSNLSFLTSLTSSQISGAQDNGKEDFAPFHELTTQQVQKIVRTTYRITRNREDAEDAMQDAFLQAFVHLGDFDGRSSFSTWLTRIAINSSLMILRKRKHAKTVSLNDASDSEESKAFQEVKDPAPDAEQRYLQEERETTLREEISALRPGLRTVVELGQLGERSMRETAEMIGVSLCAAKARLFHARKALRKSRKLRTFSQGKLAHKKSSVLALNSSL